MVVADPESTFRTQTDRDAKKRHPATKPQEVRTQLETLAVVETWNAADSFDSRISPKTRSSPASATYALAARPEPLVPTAGVAAIPKTAGNLKALLHRLPAPLIGKDKLAEAMLPTLRCKVRPAPSGWHPRSTSDRRILKQVIDLAAMSLRRSTARRV